MIIIGEKLNGSIPSVAKAIAEKDAEPDQRKSQNAGRIGSHISGCMCVSRRGRRGRNFEMDD